MIIILSAITIAACTKDAPIRSRNDQNPMIMPSSDRISDDNPKKSGFELRMEPLADSYKKFLELTLMSKKKHISVDYDINVGLEKRQRASAFSLFMESGNHSLNEIEGNYLVNGRLYSCEKTADGLSCSPAYEGYDDALQEFRIEYVGKRMIANTSSYCFIVHEQGAFEVENCYSEEGIPLMIVSRNKANSEIMTNMRATSYVARD
jgi:hypothetical protein